ncbi:SDR family NAD(P)-dependent oxidoreductase [Dactylosporangium roseum]|uniref:SDR family NAD(P)-dependent oxidoreductase n=1 Tax=Dactylosporangium roseum TaxID=47989 RepID=A0ABY5ZEL9_9ACTN|nr:type I polyketide synthase [Dactylosporangium roseum]UWZ39403.1 SDR family NAD(P)-dependent oxidoreductase [Dactylosporangium roseum]
MTAADQHLAIVGFAVRCPGARNEQEFWRNLMAGVESIEHFDSVERAEALGDLAAGAQFVPAGGVLADAERFDADFFGVAPRQAEVTDPQQRQLLEVVWEAFENAAIVPGPDLTTAVFAGTGFPTYLLFNLLGGGAANVGQYAVVIGNDKDHAATRVAHALDLRGPALTVQTACSTSLVCLHTACQSLLSAEADVAVAAACSIGFPQRRGYYSVEGGILSPDGRCRPYDADANGAVPGSGCAAVVVRRLADALRDGNPVRAVIRATAVVNDGADKAGYSAPSISGQVRAITEALTLSGLVPDDISYVEGHGTATALGDAIEVRALDRAMPRASAAPGSCRLGSVKGNVGHLDVAAGLTGLIKTVLSLEYGALPPTLHHARPHAELGLEATRFRVPNTPEPWPRGPVPRRAGVSSFGLGGTNAHVILEEAAPAAPAPDGDLPVPLLLAAGTPSALQQLGTRLRARLAELAPAALPQVAATLAFGRRHRAHRRVVVAGSVQEAIRLLERPEDIPSAGTGAGRPPRIAFLFPGAGRPAGRAERRLWSHPVFRECWQDLATHFGRLGHRLPTAPEAEAVPAAEAVRPTVSLPILFATELSLAGLWKSWGVEPAAVLGHSAGEYAAAVLAGALDVPDAVALVLERARLLEDAPPGGMVAVHAGQARAEELARDWGLSVAVVNSPSSSVLSGAVERIEAFLASTAAADADVKPVAVATAAHSPLLDPGAAVLTRFAEGLRLGAPRVAYWSSTTGSRVEEELTRARYWGEHLRQPVQFQRAVTSLADEVDMLLEVGSAATVAHFARDCLPGRAADIIDSLPHPDSGVELREAVLRARGRLWARGVATTWGDAIPADLPRVALPATPFDGPLFTRTAGVSPPADPRPWPDGAGHLARQVWTRRPADASTSVTPPQGERWLILDDGSRLASGVAHRLRAAAAEVDVVGPGRLPGPADAGPPLDPLTLARWVDDLVLGRETAGVVYFWAGGLPDGTVSLAAQDAAFTLPFLLARSLGTAGRPATLTAVTRGVLPVRGDECAEPTAALATGPVVVASREFPGLRSRLIDVDSPAGTSSPGRPDEVANADVDRLADTVVDAVLSAEPDEVVAVRAGQVWTRSWAPVTGLPESEADVGPVLVTGGLGGIGLAVARELARTGTKAIALLGRRGLPGSPADDSAETAAARRAVQEIEAAGASVVVLAADVADRPAVERSVAAVRARFGAVNLLIHAAAVPAGGLLNLRTLDECRQVLRPKTDGTRVLADVFADQPPRRVVLYSALDAVLGTLGQVDHAAANAFLDAVAGAGWFAGSHVTAVNWGAWREVGQAARTDGLGGLTAWRSGMLEQALSTRAGTRLARLALSTRERNVVASAVDVHRLLDAVRTSDVVSLVEQPMADTADATRPRPLPEESFVAPEGDAEQLVSTLWEKMVGVSPVGALDNFFALGGNSLIAMQLVARLRQHFPFRVPLATVLRHATVRDQAAWLEAELERFLAGLSDEEVRGQLAAFAGRAAVDGASGALPGGRDEFADH